MVEVLNGAAAIDLSSHRISYTSTSLIRAYTIREIIVKSTKLICTIVAHPFAASARTNTKLNTIIYRSNTYSSIIFVMASLSSDK